MLQGSQLKFGKPKYGNMIIEWFYFPNSVLFNILYSFKINCKNQNEHLLAWSVNNYKKIK